MKEDSEYEGGRRGSSILHLVGHPQKSQRLCERFFTRLFPLSDPLCIVVDLLLVPRDRYIAASRIGPSDEAGQSLRRAQTHVRILRNFGTTSSDDNYGKIVIYVYGRRSRAAKKARAGLGAAVSEYRAIFRREISRSRYHSPIRSRGSEF